MSYYRPMLISRAFTAFFIWASDKKNILTLLFALLLTVTPTFALAQQFGNFEAPLSNIDQQSIDTFIEGENPLVKYVSVVVNLITALIVVIGLISIVIGGYIYMTARGDASQVANAKTWIGSALLGITLALTAWIILNTISPQFTSGLADPSLGN